MSNKRPLTEKDFVAGGYGEYLADTEYHDKKSKEAKFSREETTKPDLRTPPPPPLEAKKRAPLDLAAVESELGWWEAIQRSDVRLFEAWLAHHGAVIVSARTINRFSAFFHALGSQRSVVMTDHDVGFTFRRLA